MHDAANFTTVLDRQVQRRPAQLAVTGGDERLTYAQLLERVCRVGSALTMLGLTEGRHVLLALDDVPDLVAAFLGCARAGLVPVPVDPLIDAATLGHLVRDSEASAVIAPRAVLDVIDRSGGTAVLIDAESRADGRVGLAEIIAAGAPTLDPVLRPPNAPAFLLYSSGSTGRPKGVVHRQKDIPAIARYYARGILNLGPSDVVLSTGRLYHAYGVSNSIAYPVWCGSTSVLLAGQRRLDSIFAAIERHRPTVFFSMPGLYKALLMAPDAAERDLSSIRLCLSAAEPLPAELLTAWRAMYGLNIIDGIGSTEMLGIFCSGRPEDVRAGSCGKPVPAYRLRLVDHFGREVDGPGEGELQVQGPSAFAEYYRQSELTARTIRDGWVRTHDRFARDASGAYFYIARTNDLIKVNGLWVSPVDVEVVLLGHPYVAEAAVVGVGHEGFTRVKAYVVTQHGANASTVRRALWDWCSNRLEPYQIPRFIEIVASLPKTPTGKIQRYRLRTQEDLPSPESLVAELEGGPNVG